MLYPFLELFGAVLAFLLAPFLLIFGIGLAVRHRAIRRAVVLASLGVAALFAGGYAGYHGADGAARAEGWPSGAERYRASDAGFDDPEQWAAAQAAGLDECVDDYLDAKDEFLEHPKTPEDRDAFRRFAKQGMKKPEQWVEEKLDDGPRRQE